MSPRKNKDLFEAICFFGRKSILKEMRYSEFEAVLDGVVGITELANKEVNAAYLKINSSLQTHSVVTFQIAFDDRGFADEDWNIPLRHLSENAGPGPDLGAGPIRLACRSQCSVSWYQRELWEPNQRDVDHFQLIRDAVKRNKLGLISEVEDEPVMVNSRAPSVLEDVVDVPLMSDAVEVPTLAATAQVDSNLIRQKLEAQATEFQNKVDLLIARQKQTLQSIDEKYKDEIDQVKRAMRNEAQSYRHRAQDLEQQANQNKVLLEKLQSHNTKLEREHIQLKEQAESQVDQYDSLKAEHLALLHKQRAAADDKSQQVVELKEQLTEKAIELSEIREELARFNAINAELTERVESYKQQVQDSSSTSSSEIIDLTKRLEQKENEAAELKVQISSLVAENERIQALMTSTQDESSVHLTKLEESLKANSLLNEELKKAQFAKNDIEHNINKLSVENEKLKHELEEAEDNTNRSSEMFDKMEGLELVFVAYHPGAGHISLPARQLEDYLEKPVSFAAQKCGVTIDHYKSWLLHYDSPECEDCSLPVKRVDTPSEFQAGVSNRCSKHRVDVSNVSMFRKSS